MYYKLTDQNVQTYNRFQWQIGKWYKIAEEDKGDELCSKSFFHCYNHPLLAILLNPIHAAYKNPRLFEIEVDGDSQEDKDLKFGFTKMRLVREIEVPQITTEQRIKFAIYCALEVYQEAHFVKWANNWLDSSDRTYATAHTAAATAHAAYAAAYAATYAAYDAAYAAADAAYDAAATDAAYAAYAATDTAAYAEINLIVLAEKAIRDES